MKGGEKSHWLGSREEHSGKFLGFHVAVYIPNWVLEKPKTRNPKMPRGIDRQKVPQ